MKIEIVPSPATKPAPRIPEVGEVFRTEAGQLCSRVCDGEGARALGLAVVGDDNSGNIFGYRLSGAYRGEIFRFPTYRVREVLGTLNEKGDLVPVAPTPDPAVRLPEVGQPWRHVGLHSIYVRIEDEAGARALSMSPESDLFFSVCLTFPCFVWTPRTAPDIEILEGTGPDGAIKLRPA